MSIKGGCSCNNIEITWHVVDYSLVPRACECEYCSAKSAAYVTQSGTGFDVLIRNQSYYKEVRHGSGSAVFHECVHCDQVIFVTSEINGELYGALNVNHLNNKSRFPASVKANFSSQTAEQKRKRWRLNWCQPVFISLVRREN